MKPEYAAVVYESLKEAGINFVAYLPDDQIHDAQKLVVEDPDFITFDKGVRVILYANITL